MGRNAGMKDLFGNEITLEEARKLVRGRAGQPNGYAARPGSGPAGETCGSCANCVRVRGGRKVYNKCKLLQHVWTSSYGTDIRRKAPACQFWKPECKEV